MTKVGSVIRWLHVPVAGVYLITLGVCFRGLIHAISWNSDLLSPMVISESLDSLPARGEAVLGTWRPPEIILDRITTVLPFHRVLWQMYPWALSLLAVSLLAWASWRLAGRWAAAMTAAAALAASASVLLTFVAQNIHGPTYVVTSLFAAFLVFTASTVRKRSTVPFLPVLTVGVVAGIVGGMDPFLFVVGVIPLVGTTVLMKLSRPGRFSSQMLLAGGGTATVCVVTALAVSLLLNSAGYLTIGTNYGKPLGLATADEFRRNLHVFGSGVLAIGNRDFLNGTVNLAPPAVLGLAVAISTAMAVPVLLLLRSLWFSRRIERDRGEVMALYTIFWGLVVVTLTAAFLSTSPFGEAGEGASRYLTPLALAIAATVPLLASQTLTGQRVAAMAVASFCAMSTLSLVNEQLPQQQTKYFQSLVTNGPEVISFLRSRGVTRGYGAYFGSFALTWKSNGAIQVYPVMGCDDPDGARTLCRFFANNVSTWYEAKPSATFLISDPTIALGVSSAPLAFGTPSEVRQIGRETVTIYPYDVAERFGSCYAVSCARV